MALRCSDVHIVIFGDSSGKCVIYVSVIVWNGCSFRVGSDDNIDKFIIVINSTSIIIVILSAISVGLSFALGVPEFAVLLLAGWAGAFTIILAGAVIYGFGDLLEITWDAIVASLESAPTPTEDLARQQPQVAVQSTSDFGHRIELPKSEQYPAFPPPSYDDATKQEAANDPWGNEKHFNHPLSSAAPSAVAPTAPFAHDDAVVINSCKPW